MAPTPGYSEEMMGDLLGDFLDESGHLLGRLNESLLALDQSLREGEPGESALPEIAELLNEMFRAAHSLKGLSGMLGLGEIHELTHRMENVLDAARREQIVLDGRVVDLLFRAVDCLSEQVEALRKGDVALPDPSAIVEAIGQLLREASAERQISSQEDAENILRQLSHLETLVGELSPGEPPREDRGEARGPGGAGELHSDIRHNQSQSEKSCDVSSATVTPLGDAKAGYFAGDRGTRSGEGHTGAGTTPAGEMSQSEDPFAGIVDDDLLSGATSAYLPLFVDEARGTLDEWHEALLSYEESRSASEIQKMMIVAHRLKGAASAVGLRSAAKVAHLAEDILQILGEGHQPLLGEYLELLFKVVDALRAYMDRLAKGESSLAVLRGPAQQLCRLKQGLEAFGSHRPGPLAPSTKDERIPASAAAEGGKEKVADLCGVDVPERYHLPWAEACASLVSQGREKGSAYAGIVLFRPELQLAGLKARLIVEKLGDVAEVAYCFPKVAELEEADGLDGLVFACWSEASEETLRRQLTVGGVDRVVLRRVSPEGPAQGEVAAGQPGRNRSGQKVEEPVAAETAQNASPDADSLEAATTTQAVGQLPDNAGKQPTLGGGPLPSFCNVESTLGAASRLGTDRATSSPGQELAGKSQSLRCEVQNRSGSSGPQVNETLRVDIERLDELMNLTGELVIQRARLNQLVENLRTKMAGSSFFQLTRWLKEFLGRATAGGATSAGDFLGVGSNHSKTLWRIVEQLEAEQREWLALRALSNELRVSVHQLDRITDRLQQTVMNTRMVPIGPLLHRFKRVVRDLVRNSGKQIRLVILGEKTELDKRMIDELADPLIHLVRNAADHGIELPEERLRLGKPAEGTIVLEACHKGNAIIIRVSDDGRGLDAEKIRRKAVEKGLLSPTEAERLSLEETYQLIWRPGLSTAEKVTEVSGRGMGMDIVKAKIESLNGTVELQTELGRGTTFTIKLPLTLAILPSLLVRVADNTFALPVDTIVEIVQLGKEQIATVQGMATAVVRGRVIPICHLQELFVWNTGLLKEVPQSSALSSPRGEDAHKVTLVILGDRQREIALEVDYVIGEEDLVIKSLADNYRTIAGLTGASILGDGSVALILDVAALVDMACGTATSRW